MAGVHQGHRGSGFRQEELELAEQLAWVEEQRLLSRPLSIFRR